AGSILRARVVVAAYAFSPTHLTRPVKPWRDAFTAASSSMTYAVGFLGLATSVTPPRQMCVTGRRGLTSPLFPVGVSLPLIQRLGTRFDVSQYPHGTSFWQP